VIKAPTKIAPQKKPNIVISCYKISLKIKGAIIVVFMQVHDMAKDKILEHFAIRRKILHHFYEGISHNAEDDVIESPKRKKVLRKSPIKTTTNLVPSHIQDRVYIKGLSHMEIFYTYVISM
jgi:hypothetical protein